MVRPIALALPTAGASTFPGCVDAIFAQVGVELDVLVIENVDGGALVDSATQRFAVERPGCNLGVAASWNLACEWAWSRGHDGVVILNDDIVLRDPHTLARVSSAADTKPDALLVLDGCGFSAMYVPRSVHESIGPFDSGFWPAYFEDVDMHRRLALAGIAVEEVEAEVEHTGSASIGGDSELATLVAATFPRNRERYRAKWGGLPTEETFAEPWAGWPRGGPRVVVAMPTLPERADTCAEAAELYRQRSPIPVEVVLSTACGGWCAGLNDVWRRRPGADVFVCGSDDMVPEEGWLAPLLACIQGGGLPAPCVTDPRWTNYGGFDEPVPDGTPSPRCTFPVLAGMWLDAVFPLPDDLHYFGDDLIRDRLARIGVSCVAVPSSRIQHRWDQRGRGAGAGSEAARMEVDGPRYARELNRMPSLARAAPRLTVVIPTDGRPTLRRTLESLALQLGPRDEVFVVADGPQPLAREICTDFQKPTWSYVEHVRTGDFGNSQREAGIAQGTGDFLCLIDDDDAYMADAFAAIRLAVTTSPNRPHMFRMDNYGSILWRAPELVYGNVGTPMFVSRLDRARLGRWDANDFAFISRTIELQGEPIWHEDVVAVVRPHLRDGLPV